MNIHEIKNFLVLARLLHFGKASQACHLSPSALTRCIQRLEGELGQELFYRDKRGVSLTQAGEKFRVYAQGAVREWENLCEGMRNEGEVSGLVSIYASVTAVYSILPNLLESYRAAYPKVQLELRTGSAEEAIQQVIDGTIDLSVAALPDRQHSGLAFMPLLETQLVFVGPGNGADVPMKDGRLDLSEAPLVLPRSGLSRSRFDQWLKENQSTVKVGTEVSGNEGILAMVRLGCGVGMVPELVWERSPFRDDLRKIEAAPVLAPYVVGLCTTEKNLGRMGIAALWELAGGRCASSEGLKV